MPRADAAAVAVVDVAGMEGILKHCLVIHISANRSDQMDQTSKGTSPTFLPLEFPVKTKTVGTGAARRTPTKPTCQS